jgi:hypothetical protein
MLLQGYLGYDSKVEGFSRIAFSDKILGITEAFKADSFKEKINLGALKKWYLNWVVLIAVPRRWRIP